MFNTEDFQDNIVLEQIADKLNKLYAKDKKAKIIKIINENLEPLIEEEDSVVPVTYLLSIVAENDIESISESILTKVEPFLSSENEKLKTNSILIVGFKMLSNPEYKHDSLSKFVNLLIDDSGDIRHNAHFFLGEMIKDEPSLACSQKSTIIKALDTEKNEENIVSLLKCLSHCNSYSFKQEFKLKEILKTLVLEHYQKDNSDLDQSLLEFIKIAFTSLKKVDLENMECERLAQVINGIFVMKRQDFTKTAKNEGKSPKDFWKKIKENALKEKEIFVYTKNEKSKAVAFFQLEKEKVVEFFERNEKITSEEISQTFANIISSKSDLKGLIKVLANLDHVKGYYSKLGFFYPFSYIKNSIMADFQKSGMISLKKYDFLPQSIVFNVVKELSLESNQIFLEGKSGQAFFSLKKIQDQINTEAARNSSIDLKPYRERLKDEQFIVLIKNLPQDYLTNFHKGTNWLTNIGITKIKSEVDNSKIIGYFDLTRISKKLNIVKILLMDILEEYIDLRSGIWDKEKNVFYYSKHITDKIDEIGSISDETEKNKRIHELAASLNIDKNIILTKIDENLQSIGKEITEQDQVSISEYLGKLGMEYETFLNFIHDLGLNYFIKGDLLILNKEKIEEAKTHIISMILEKSKSSNFITFGNFDANSGLIEDLIRQLKGEERIKGIFYSEDGELRFYTTLGIKNMMLENSLMFSFNDLFYGKELSEEEVSLMKEVFDELIASKKLVGVFEGETLTFSSDEVLFVTDYNAIVHDFERLVNVYIKRFEKELESIKKVLTKRREIIYPQEIKLIQETIDKINLSYVKWRAQIDSVIRKTDNKILKEQGYSVKRYQGLAEDKKAEIKSFKSDQQVQDIVKNFNRWVEFFNELELTYGKIIFLQKKLITTPEDTESEQKLEELLEGLGLLG